MEILFTPQEEPWGLPYYTKILAEAAEATLLASSEQVLLEEFMAIVEEIFDFAAQQSLVKGRTYYGDGYEFLVSTATDGNSDFIWIYPKAGPETAGAVAPWKPNTGNHFGLHVHYVEDHKLEGYTFQKFYVYSQENKILNLQCAWKESMFTSAEILDFLVKCNSNTYANAFLNDLEITEGRIIATVRIGKGNQSIVTLHVSQIEHEDGLKLYWLQVMSEKLVMY